MKVKNSFNLLVAGLVLTLVVSGCHRKPNPPITIIPAPKTGAPRDPGQGGKFDQEANPETTAHPQGPGHEGWTEERDTFKADTVYFEYDSTVIKSGEKSKIESVAAYLKEHANDAVKVEGNCDERGTEEYNRSLGERRALAIREQLIRDGIDMTRIDTVSYGKDRPVDPARTEAAYKKNRRGEFVLLTPPK